MCLTSCALWRLLEIWCWHNYLHWVNNLTSRTKGLFLSFSYWWQAGKTSVHFCLFWSTSDLFYLFWNTCVHFCLFWNTSIHFCCLFWSTYIHFCLFWNTSFHFSFVLFFPRIPHHILYPTEADGSLSVIADYCEAGDIAEVWDATEDISYELLDVLSEAVSALRASSWDFYIQFLDRLYIGRVSEGESEWESRKGEGREERDCVCVCQHVWCVHEWTEMCVCMCVCAHERPSETVLPSCFPDLDLADFSKTHC